MALAMTKHTATKLLELILVCVLIGCYYSEEGSYNRTNSLLASGTFFGYLIILVGVFAGGIMGTPINRRIDLFFCLVGCALFIAVGSLWVDRYGSDTTKAIGAISIIEGIIFFIDAILVFRNEP